LFQFCSARKLHYDNMVDHVSRPTSDQKNGGWRLVERLRAIGHVDRPTEHILALGTLEDFHKHCQSSTDGRAVLKSRSNLTKLVGGYYKGGKPWNGWETRSLTTAEKLQLLHQSQQQPLPAAGTVALPQMALPDYGIAEVQMDDAACESSGSAVSDGARALGCERQVRCLPRLVFLHARPMNARSSSCPSMIPPPQPERSRFRSAPSHARRRRTRQRLMMRDALSTVNAW
jgi:hypothetical protein